MAELSIKLLDQKSLREKLSLWDTNIEPKAQLTDRQKDILIEVSSQAQRRPLPIELPLDDVPTPQLAAKEDNAPIDTESMVFLKGSEFGEKIENAQQFFSWFAEIEENISKEEEVPYRNYILELEDYKKQCQDVLQEVTDAITYLNNLQEQYNLVSFKTNALHEACEHLLAKQSSLMNTAENISNKLSYFNELERISSKLGSPAFSVTNDSFVPMLARLDECILYIASNPRYKESQVYLARFKQCLSRALTLIKSHVITILQNASQQVLPKKDTPNAGDDAFTLFYGKFRANAPRVHALMEQLEQRINKSQEYTQILNDCHQCYFSQRELLLGPSVESTIADLATRYQRDHCALMRSGCAFMVHVCEDEYQLYFNFFSKPSPHLDEMLEKLCTYLYDVFRPLIIHINHLETLAELCAILKIEMIEEHVRNNPQELKAFENICGQMLMDVQERLVYRTYIYIKNDIFMYKAASGDLAYPEKLEMMESISENIRKDKGHSRNASNASSTSLEVAQITAGDIGNEIKEGEESSITDTVPFNMDTNASSMPMSPADLHGMWYPTVRRTLVTLSKLYRCIDRTTFQGLSQEALQSCIQSLLVAKEGIIKRKALLDGQMFMIKHLLILREQIAPFQADFSIRETSLDFSKMKYAAYSLFTKKSQLFALNSNNALLQFILEGTPQVTEHFVDSKKDVDAELKKNCEEFIRHITDYFTEPLKSFLTKANVIVNMNKEEGAQKVSVRNQPFAVAEKLHDVVAESYKNLKTRLPIVRRSMSLYLANKDTEYILFKPIKVSVQQNYQQLSQLLSAEYTSEDEQIVACPSAEQINLLLSPTK
ncbi:COG3 [Acanthosepion pharaonis]|uniref:Conserved oligomeric Golgi complex subunit 3 n=1 Tax=Acanthosepion pharaonis TaxID=158019 RepID=A0A812BDZ9_ACAPH|nr:COG3 [Sepia pharaonis]